MSQSGVKIINMSKFKPGNALKNSTTTSSGIELTVRDLGALL